MSPSAQIPVSEYLSTIYHPDREYVDGQLVERHVGMNEHSRLQALLAAWFASREDEWQIATFTEQRLQVGPTRFRLPDVLLTKFVPQPSVITAPPVLCVEILSTEDAFEETKQKADEYFAMGTTAVWIIDPVFEDGCWGMESVGYTPSLEVPGTPIYANLPPMFKRLQMTLVK